MDHGNMECNQNVENLKDSGYIPGFHFQLESIAAAIH